MKKKTWILKMKVSETVEDNEEFYLDGSGLFVPEEFIEYHAAAGIAETTGDVEEVEIISVEVQKI